MPYLSWTHVCASAVRMCELRPVGPSVVHCSLCARISLPSAVGATMCSSWTRRLWSASLRSSLSTATCSRRLTSAPRQAESCGRQSSQGSRVCSAWRQCARWRSWLTHGSGPCCVRSSLGPRCISSTSARCVHASPKYGRHDMADPHMESTFQICNQLCAALVAPFVPGVVATHVRVVGGGSQQPAECHRRHSLPALQPGGRRAAYNDKEANAEVDASC